MDMLERALSYYGLAEVEGKDSNPVIRNMFLSFGYPDLTDNDGWCAVFLSQCARESGFPLPNPPVLARKWLTVGSPVTHPHVGDVVVFWRGSKTSWQGHCGLYINEASSTMIHVLGGNQENKVTIKAYPKARVLGYRRLSF